MSFQITVLKVLAGQREGRLSLAELRHDVAIDKVSVRSKAPSVRSRA